MLKHIPNILTLGRLVLTVAFLAMVLYVPYVSQDKLTLFWNVTFVVFVVAGLTDLMDGMVARGLGVTS
ncbi:MAG TPA: CDP-alcohol phosphatidyltransferase family protein, partial [Sedimentisphaerales bacterium]|nr:CDP-alcohol phosphatidyltransferase family protein [Sedimentisphaerales bacterium]